jgi:hypothetical protein
MRRSFPGSMTIAMTRCAIACAADQGEIVKRRGYLPPRPMASMLQAIIDDPTPGPSVVEEAPLTVGTESALTSDARDELRSTLIENYDPKNRGWGTVQKFLDADLIEYALNESTGGDGRFERMARETLSAELEASRMVGRTRRPFASCRCGVSHSREIRRVPLHREQLLAPGLFT